MGVAAEGYPPPPPRTTPDRREYHLRLSEDFPCVCLIPSVRAPSCFHSSGCGLAQQAPPKPVALKAPWKVDDVVLQEQARGWALSRDGTRALWIKRVADKKKDAHVGQLMLTVLPNGEHRPLTVGQDGIASPAFSPSGRFISFLSPRKFPAGMKGPKKEEAGSQVWLLDLLGGEARPVTAIPFGVGGYQWLDDDTLVLTARERLSREEALAKKDKDNAIVVEDDRLFRMKKRRLFRYRIKKRKLERLTRDAFPITTFRASPKGRWIAFTLARSPRYTAEQDVPPQNFLLDTQTGQTRELFADTKTKAFGFAWSHDESVLYCQWPQSTVDGETWGATIGLRTVDPQTGAVQDVPLGHEPGIGSSFTVLSDGFLARLCNGVRPMWRRYVREGSGFRTEEMAFPKGHHVWSLIKARDADRVLIVRGNASNPDAVHTGMLKGSSVSETKEILRPNDGFKNRAIAKVEVRRWKGARGEEVEGLLYHPHDARGDEKRPLVLITHGGPHGADHDRFSERWSNTPNLYCQRGAFVLKTNYHGSSDYGLAFGESIKGRYYELELQDMFAGIRMLIDESLVDPDRLGLVGWSNGAILSIAALTHAHLYAPGYDFDFKACAPGAGDVNWTSDFGNCAFGASFDEFYIGGTPWDDPKTYIEKSPLFEVEAGDHADHHLLRHEGHRGSDRAGLAVVSGVAPRRSCTRAVRAVSRSAPRSGQADASTAQVERRARVVRSSSVQESAEGARAEEGVTARHRAGGAFVRARGRSVRKAPRREARARNGSRSQRTSRSAGSRSPRRSGRPRGRRRTPNGRTWHSVSMPTPRVPTWRGCADTRASPGVS